MTNSHITQYIIIALIALVVIFFILRRLKNIKECDNANEVCQCCSSKSICGKIKKSTKHIAKSKKQSYLCTRKPKDGSLDEWLSQRSAKPCTAVRIRQEPQKALVNQSFFRIYTYTITTHYNTYIKKKSNLPVALFCDSHRIQTCNLLIRSQMLYSVELANHFSFANAKLTYFS